MKKKVVVLGGGTGISYLLKGLKDFPLDITAIITVADNGKSTGKLREEFLTPAVGDIRKVLTNLSTLPNEIKDVMEYRFNTYSDLNGHSIGNLLLTAFLNKTKNFKQSIEYMSSLLDVKHKVLPLSEDYLTLMAESSEGEKIIGEAAIGKCGKQIEKVFYREKPHVLNETISAISEADLIIVSMGSLYTSIIPHLICDEVREAITKSQDKLMYLCNIMTQPGETTSSNVSEYLEILHKYLKDRKIDVVIASNTEISKEMLKKYEEESKEQVLIDKNRIEEMNVELIEDDLITLEDGTIKHNSLKLSSIVFSYLMR